MTHKFFENQERVLINHFKMKEEIAKISEEPGNKRLKYIAVGIMAAAIILELIILIWMGDLSDTAILWLQGFTGVLAIIFVIIAAIWSFRIYNTYNRQKYNKTTNHNPKS